MSGQRPITPFCTVYGMQTDQPTVIEYDDHEYIFEGFSLLSHTPLVNVSCNAVGCDGNGRDEQRCCKIDVLFLTGSAVNSNVKSSFLVLDEESNRHHC